MNQKNILLTGGTGSFGNAFVDYVLTHFKPQRIVIYSRDELKHYTMQNKYPINLFPQLKYIIGDVRDKRRLTRAFEGIDTVVHAAAMKHVHLSEQNPTECIHTNIKGAENVIDCCLESSTVKNVIALSTDKAASPTNLYGATKLVSDKLFITANTIKGKREIKFSVVRYGNVMGASGSVIPLFLQLKKENKPITITHEKMTRFNILPEDGVKLVLFALNNHWGGEIFVPKSPSFKIIDLVKAIAPINPIEIVGIRAGEKILEEMITHSDSYYTYDIGKYYVILPQRPSFETEKYIKHFTAKGVENNFSYNSENNLQWLTVKELQKLISKI